ncbi:uncharacterized protein LOC122059620 isoform X2 [Macadamia integrifolia]|uniref:uncharacterized protein LOC122059620 isoform X2 n=1 Tax=Macadamia integrifolia TaxID=60698 RepID=UPI001C52CFEB|nr:uncharacterized protein LOC122059620 isoform X2 [Macadamia integrifolia]
MERNSQKVLFCYCMTGGELLKNPDGSVAYRGGITEGLRVDESTQYDDFVAQVCSKLKVDPSSVTLKYTIQYDKARLLTLAGQAEIANLLDFNQGTADVYVIKPEETLLQLHLPVISRCSGSVATELALEDSNYADSLTTEERPPLLATSWASTIEGVGQIFDSADAFRDELNKYSIACGFGYKYMRNASVRMIAQCEVDGCPWIIAASMLGKTGKVRVYKYERAHNHKDNCQQTTKVRMPKRLIAKIMANKVRENPGYLPVDIIKDFKRDYHVDLTYQQAWRGKEIALQEVNGSFLDSYKLLPGFCQRVMKSNPGTLAVYTQKDDSTFNQLFISFHASTHGFRLGCRPVLFVDSILLKGKFLSTFLSATAMDANDDMFPVAFAVVESGSLQDWTWFLENLKVALKDSRDIIFVSDWNEHLVQAVNDIYSSVSHAHCYRHLSGSFKSFLKGLHLSNSIKDALMTVLDKLAYSRNRIDFDSALGQMQSISNEAYDWVLESEPMCWANSLFPGRRYDKFSLNFNESFNKWVQESQELPIMGFVNLIRLKIADFMCGKRTETAAWEIPVGCRIDDKLKGNIEKSQGYGVHYFSDSKFEVCVLPNKYVVDLHNRSCTCREWDMIGLPCEHACAALRSINADVYQYVEAFYLKETQQAIYSEQMHPVPIHEIPVGATTDGNSDEGSSTGLGLRPPSVRRLPGRPKGKQVKPDHGDKRPLHCAHCKEVGHNRRKCKAQKLALPEITDFLLVSFSRILPPQFLLGWFWKHILI